MLRYRVFRWGAWMLERLPRPAAYLFALLVGEAFFALNRAGRRVALTNARAILGQQACDDAILRAVRGSFRAAAWYYTDLARTPRIDPARFNACHIHDTGYEHIERAVAAGKGVVIATLHYGNPEYVSQCLPARGLRHMALVERLDPPELAALFRRYRQSHGHQSVDATVGGLKTALRHLRGGGVVAVLIDRDLYHTGVRVPFLGRTARVPTGAVDLALHTGAAIVPLITHRRGFDHFDVVVGPAFELERTGNLKADRIHNTARLIQYFEPDLRQDPSQWFMLEESIWSGRCRERRSADGRG